MVKSYILLSLGLLASATSFSQTLHKVENPEGRELRTLAISPNGKYIAGSDFTEKRVFVCDWEKNQTTIGMGDLTLEANVTGVNDNGVAAGLSAGGAFTLAADGTETYLSDNEVDGNTAHAISNDGTLVVGSTYANDGLMIQHACYWKNGERVALPEPTSEEAGFTVNGTCASYVSGDGSIILGYIVDDLASNPFLLWYLQEDGTYKVDYSFVKENFEPGWGDKPYFMLMPSGISNNGKYLALTTQANSSDLSVPYLIARYNLETKTLETMELNAEAGIDETSECAASSIANDGTIVGSTGWTMGFGARRGIIWKTGEAKVSLLADAFKDVEGVADLDEILCNTVTSISADGRYIAGFTANSASGSAYFSFVLDTKAASGISSTVADKASRYDVYSVSGTLVSSSKGEPDLNSLKPGLYIVNGKKVAVK